MTSTTKSGSGLTTATPRVLRALRSAAIIAAFVLLAPACSGGGCGAKDPTTEETATEGGANETTAQTEASGEGTGSSDGGASDVQVQEAQEADASAEPEDQATQERRAIQGVHDLTREEMQRRVNEARERLREVQSSGGSLIRDDFRPQRAILVRPNAGEGSGEPAEAE